MEAWDASRLKSQVSFFFLYLYHDVGNQGTTLNENDDVERPLHTISRTRTNGGSSRLELPVSVFLSTNLKMIAYTRVGNDSNNDERPPPQTITIKSECKFIPKLLIMRLRTVTGNENYDIEQPTSHTITNGPSWTEARNATQASSNFLISTKWLLTIRLVLCIENNNENFNVVVEWPPPHTCTNTLDGDNVHLSCC